MATPAWTAQYNYSKTTAQNGFTEVTQSSPVVTRSGTNVVIDSTNGNAIFITSQVPSLDSSVGATAEATIAVTGAGDAGFELDFLDNNVQILIFTDHLEISLLDNTNHQNINTTYSTSSNAVPTIWRATLDGSKNLNVYRAGVLVAGPIACPVGNYPFQRVLWWVEGGAVGTFTELAYYLGGAVAP